MGGLLTGGAYAVSAGLLIYAIEKGLVADSDQFLLIIGWAVAGLVLAILSVAIQASKADD